MVHVFLPLLVPTTVVPLPHDPEAIHAAVGMPAQLYGANEQALSVPIHVQFVLVLNVPSELSV